MSTNNSSPLMRLRYHVTGAIERGEREAIVEQPLPVSSKTRAISIWEELDENSENGRYVTAWSFFLLGEEFGGYAANNEEAFSDAESVLREKVDGLTHAQIAEAYLILGGTAIALSEAESFATDGARELLFQTMSEP